MVRLSKTVNKLEEKFRALNSAIKLYSFAGNKNRPKPSSADKDFDWQEVFPALRDLLDLLALLDQGASQGFPRAQMTRTWMMIWTVGSSPTAIPWLGLDLALISSAAVREEL